MIAKQQHKQLLLHNSTKCHFHNEQLTICSVFVFFIYYIFNLINQLKIFEKTNKLIFFFFRLLFDLNKLQFWMNYVVFLCFLSFLVTPAVSFQKKPISYSLVINPSSLFSISAETGEISLTRSIDYESDQHRYLLLVRASEGQDSMRSAAEVCVLSFQTHVHLVNITCFVFLYFFIDLFCIWEPLGLWCTYEKFPEGSQILDYCIASEQAFKVHECCLIRKYWVPVSAYV